MEAMAKMAMNKAQQRQQKAKAIIETLFKSSTIQLSHMRGV